MKKNAEKTVNFFDDCRIGDFGFKTSNCDANYPHKCTITKSGHPKFLQTMPRFNNVRSHTREEIEWLIICTSEYFFSKQYFIGIDSHDTFKTDSHKQVPLNNV